MSAENASQLSQKLSGPLDAVLTKHRADICRLAGNSGSLTANALKDDALVRKIAEYCHDALPWPLRMAVKKPAFVDFVMANRGTVIARLTVADATPAAG